MPIAISTPVAAALAVGPTVCSQDIFRNPGRVISVDTCPLPITVSMQCWKPGDVFRAIITSVGVSAQGGFQFMHTLKNYIYLYTFNERIGEMTVSGVTFAGGCVGDSPAGIESVIGYYNKMRTTRRYSPIQVAIGRLAFNAFLLGVRTAIADAEAGLGQFTFNLYYPPTDTDNLGVFNASDAIRGGDGVSPGCLWLNLPSPLGNNVP